MASNEVAWPSRPVSLTKQPLDYHVAALLVMTRRIASLRPERGDPENRHSFSMSIVKSNFLNAAQATILPTVLVVLCPSLRLTKRTSPPLACTISAPTTRSIV